MGAGATGEVIHATAVALKGRAALILGPSGSGKSGLALELMAFGAALIADDRVALSRKGAALIASAPARLPAKIEARGVGLLAAELAPPAPVMLAVDLGRSAVQRLPEQHSVELMGLRLPCVHKTENSPFAAAILQYLKGARTD